MNRKVLLTAILLIVVAIVATRPPPVETAAMSWTLTPTNTQANPYPGPVVTETPVDPYPGPVESTPTPVPLISPTPDLSTPGQATSIDIVQFDAHSQTWWESFLSWLKSLLF